MARVIGSVARWTARTRTDKTITVPSSLGPIVGGFLQRIAVPLPTPQLVEGSLVATWTATRCGSGYCGRRRSDSAWIPGRAERLGALGVVTLADSAVSEWHGDGATVVNLLDNSTRRCQRRSKIGPKGGVKLVHLM